MNQHNNSSKLASFAPKWVFFTCTCTRISEPQWSYTEKCISALPMRPFLPLHEVGVHHVRVSAVRYSFSLIHHVTSTAILCFNTVGALKDYFQFFCVKRKYMLL